MKPMLNHVTGDRIQPENFSVCCHTLTLMQATERGWGELNYTIDSKVILQANGD
jgi:hypothetical protein